MRAQPKTAKPFAWSISRVENFELCPKKYYEAMVRKPSQYPEEQGEAMTWGNEVHTQIEKLAKGNSNALPMGMRHFEELVRPIIGAPGESMTELKLAINKQTEPVDYFANDVWARAIVDYGKVSPPNAVIVDWKTGKEKSDLGQLMTMAAVFFSHAPEVEQVTAAYVWLKSKNMTTEVYKREDLPKIWNHMMPRVAKLEKAHVEDNFPPKPNFLCRKWCPVTGCPHHGS